MSADARPPAAEPAAAAAGQDAVVDLLGALAYAELTAFLRMAADAGRAPGLEVRVALARMATVEFGHYERIATRLDQLGREPAAAMAPFVDAVNAFHDRTTPRDWLEGLVKAYVGDGIGRDFYREIAANLGPDDERLVHHVLGAADQDEFVVRMVGQAIAEDPTVAGRLALWGRRLVGEAIAQAQYIAVERDALAGLIVGGGPAGGGLDLAELGRLFARLTDAHVARMQRMGLSH